MLLPEEIRELLLAREPDVCRELGLGFFHDPVPDHGAPAALEPTAGLACRLAGEVRRGTGVAIHCRAGVGRSSLVAAAVLLLSGVPLPDAWARLRAARGWPLPGTRRQGAWVDRFAASLRRLDLRLSPDP